MKLRKINYTVTLLVSIWMLLTIMSYPTFGYNLKLETNTDKTIEYSFHEYEPVHKKSGFVENQGQWAPEFEYIGTTEFGHIGFGIGCLYLDFIEIKNNTDGLNVDEEGLQNSGFVVNHLT